MLPHSIVGKAVPSFHSGTSCIHISEHFSNFDGLQCVEFSLPVGYLASGDLFHLYFEVGIGGHLSMSAHGPRLQFITWLHDSPKTEAKGVVLVKGPWYETLGSPRLPFDLN